MRAQTNAYDAAGRLVKVTYANGQAVGYTYDATGNLLATALTLALAAPAVTTQPAAQSVTAGGSAIFSVVASGNPAPTYQWEVSTNGGSTWSRLTDGTGISGSATATLTLSGVAVTLNGNEYACVVINSQGSVTSQSATLSVTGTLAITTQPTAQTVTAGSTATFTIGVTGTPTPTYQWEVSTNGGGAWSNLSDGSGTTGSRTATLNLIAAGAAMSGNLYACVATNSAGTVTSQSALLTVNFAPTVTTPPAAQTTTTGGSATFTVVATGSPAPTYQWRVSTTSGVTWTNLTDGSAIFGSTKASLVVVSAAAGLSGDLYDCVVTNSVGSATSTGALLTVNAPATGAPVVTTLLANDASLHGPMELATDGTNLFVDGTNAKTSDPIQNATSHQAIFRVPLAGGAATSLYPAYNPQQLVFLGSTLYWIDPNSGSLTDTQILSAPAAGGGAVAPIYNSPSNQVIFDGSGLATDGTLLYATDFSGGKVFKLATNGSGLVELGGVRYTTPEQRNLVAAYQSVLYIVDAGTSGATPDLVTIPTTGSSFSKIVSGAPLVQPAGVAVGGGNIYVADAGANNTIWQIPLPNGTPTAWVSGTPFKGLGGLLYYNGALYVADTTGNAIYKIAPGSNTSAPTITAQPAAQTAAEGAGASFSVGVAGGTNLTYQWYFNGTAISGATSATYAVSNVLPSAAGTYWVEVSYGTSELSSFTATLAVTAPSISPAAQTVAAGASPTLTINAVGSGLTYQWQFNGANLPGATGATLSLPNIGTTQAGNYTAVVTSAGNALTTAPATVTVDVTSHLINLSSRSYVGTGAQVLIAGFVVGGTGAKQVLMRGDGPILTKYSVSGVLATPQLSLFDNTSAVIATNTGWSNPSVRGGSTVAATIAAATTNVFNQVYAFTLPTGSADSALVAGLPSAAYTVEVSGVGSTTGVALAELYDADTGTPTAHLINLSARAFVNTGSGVLVAGFVISGTSSETILIRGVGPALGQAPFNLPGVLATPQLTLFDSTDAVVATNTGWSNAPVTGPSTVAAGIQTATATVMSSLYAFSLTAGSPDCALVVTLPPGAYTAQVSGLNATTGVGLVEIYDVP